MIDYTVKEFKSRGITFTARIRQYTLSLDPPDFIKTEKELMRFSPTEMEVSEALGFKVIWIDDIGLTSIYKIMEVE